MFCGHNYQTESAFFGEGIQSKFGGILGYRVREPKHPFQNFGERAQLVAHTGWAKKVGHGHMTITRSNLNRFLFFSTGRFLGKFVVKCILKSLQIKKGLLLTVRETFLIGENLAKLQARAWLSHALCASGQHTAKRRRKCTRQSRSCL